MLEGGRQSLAVAKVTNPRWSAPEVISHNVVSKSADVFSFAVVMWEMLTWQQPYDDMMSVQVGEGWWRHEHGGSIADMLLSRGDLLGTCVTCHPAHTPGPPIHPIVPLLVLLHTA